MAWWRPIRYRCSLICLDESEEIDELMMIRNDEEPVSYTEASKKREWVEAMDAELSSIEKNKTWTLVDLPKNRKAIDLKWVYKVKRDPSRKTSKYKARVVVKGYVQKRGVDYDEVFAPVARIEKVRVILALAGSNGWRVHHLDVKSAFQNGTLEEEVYVSQPEGYIKKGEANKVYKLSKALYGLKQAPRAWNACLDKYLKSLGFVRCAQEYSVYTKKKDDDVLIIGVYVDGSNRDWELESTRKHENNEARRLFRSILDKDSYDKCNPSKRPMEHKLKLTKDGEGELINPTEYRSIVGGLRYLTHTRPDISFAVGVVKAPLDHGLLYTRGESKVTITGYSDSDLANDVNDRKSTGGMAFYVNGNLVTWSSQKQRVVALSSCEAKFIAATMAACQGIWLRRLLTEITKQRVPPVTLFEYSMMVELADALEKQGISAFRFDFSGNGESEGTFEFGNYRKEVNDLHAVVQHFTATNRVISAILGHSKVVNVSGRYKMDRGIEERLGKDHLERVKKDSFIDIKTKTG
ncbi:putative RNA-directed DNA polymerase [Tanacetum coccineum]